MHDEMHEGHEIDVRGPRRNFHLAPAPRYIFIAGGIGITPILPMAAAAEEAGAEVGRPPQWDTPLWSGLHAGEAFIGSEQLNRQFREPLRGCGRDIREAHDDPGHHL